MKSCVTSAAGPKSRAHGGYRCGGRLKMAADKTAVPKQGELTASDGK